MNTAHPDKVAVTGGSSGIGLACALAYARMGSEIAIVARDHERLSKARERLVAVQPVGTDARVLTVSADLSDLDATVKAFDYLSDEGFVPDLLINSAGIITPGEFCDMSPDDFGSNIDYGFWTVVNPCKAVAPAMRERHDGYIVNVSSVAGYMGIYGYTGYSAAKFASFGFTEALRCELKPEGVGVSVVCPPDTDTPALAREKTLRPPETDAISGNLAAVQPDVIAHAIVRGVAKRKYLIIPGFVSKVYFRLKGILPEVFFAVIDGDVRKVRKHKGAK